MHTGDDEKPLAFFQKEERLENIPTVADLT